MFAFIRHASGSSEVQRCESSLLNFQNPFRVQPLLLISMFAINLLNGVIFVRLCVWVTSPHVEKGRTLPIPKATGMNIQSDIRCLVRTPCQQFIVNTLSPEEQVSPACTSWQTMFSISASRSRSSLCHWMMNPPLLHTMAWSPWISTNASGGRVHYVPVIADMKGIPEFSLV